MKRRDFIKSSAFAGGAHFLLKEEEVYDPKTTRSLDDPIRAIPANSTHLPDLQPARWIWYPSGRCLANTFVLFRRNLYLQKKPRRAQGWIAADSRYRLEVNGKRIQWGPAPSDPRWLEADPIDLTAVLQVGDNTIGAQVLFYGLGDGTSPVGKPGFLFWLEMTFDDASQRTLVSNSSWKAMLPRSWKPGHYKRWYVRSLQEEFDARLYPYGWANPEFHVNSDWLDAMPLECAPDKPPVCSKYPEYLLDTSGEPRDAQLRPRSIPQMNESLVSAEKLAEFHWISWLRPPEEYFECRPPKAYRAQQQATPAEVSPGVWQLSLDGIRGAALSFVFTEQVVGWPYFTIEAPAGTTIELLVHEAHSADGPPILNTHFESWSRFICREGKNRFETFDFESCRWLQLHVHQCDGSVRISDVGIRRRVYPWPNVPIVRSSEPALQRLFDASINTLNNSAQENIVDGMARERQQYSGDCGHQLHAIYPTFGESRLPARYLMTFSQGMTLDGYFLDCWPAYDRLARLMERQVQLTRWGPILDHGVGFNFDCYYAYLYSGDLKVLNEPFPRLLRFAQYLKTLIGPDGLLPVEDIGVPSVWIDHDAYRQQRHKQCAFNLYAAAMLQHALAPLCRLFGETRRAYAASAFGRQLEAAVVRKFWSRDNHLFVNNLPWLTEEKEIRLCDRSLATAILFDQCPEYQSKESLRTLAETPSEMGLSYPANAGWRLWALAKGGRTDVVVKELRERWANMDSVRLNNALQENWHVKPDSDSQWSHCPVVPLYVAMMNLAGIRPIEAGFKRFEIFPQLADLEDLELTAYTPQGPIHFSVRGKKGNRILAMTLPVAGRGELLLPEKEAVTLQRLSGSIPRGWSRYELPPGKTITLQLRYM
jgi:alpha-L-rhamnosidase